MRFPRGYKIFALIQRFLRRFFCKKARNYASDVGLKSESIAVSYLKQKGIKILARNWRYKHYEIDIIGLDAQNTLVFVEVRARADHAKQSGYYTVDQKKKRALKMAVKAYIQNFPKKSKVSLGFRFDIIELEWHFDKSYHCRHFENVALFPKYFC